LNVIENFINGKAGINIIREKLADIQKLAPIFKDLNITVNGSSNMFDILQRLESFFYGGWRILFVDNITDTSVKDLNAYTGRGADAYIRTHGLYSLCYFMSVAEEELYGMKQVNIQECDIMGMFE